MSRPGRGSHPALNRPWLTAVAAGGFPDMAWALRDYAWDVLYDRATSWRVSTA